MKKLLMMIEEDYVKENAFILKTSEFQFMRNRILIALMTCLMISLIYYVKRDTLLMLMIIVGTVIMYEYPLMQMKQYKKKQQNLINSAFPQWVMQLEVLVMTNTIPLSIQKSYEVCPSILKDEVKKLSQKVMNDPINKDSYLDFLKGYQTTDIIEVMLSLYQYNFSTKENMAYDFQILHKRLDKLKSEARLNTYKEKEFLYGMLLIIEPMIACVWILGMVMQLSNLIMMNI